MNIENIAGGELSSAPWRSTYTLKPDQRTLVSSLRTYGWLQPIVAQASTGLIIDGHERWKIAAADAEVFKRDKGMVPVLWVECDEVDAMIMHVKVNRSRGIMHASSLSKLLKRILRSGAYESAELKSLLGMSKDEFDLLIAGSFFKTRKISEHTYSKAWVPIEAPPGAISPSANIERPPNADR
jgi:hypothetical protein